MTACDSIFVKKLKPRQGRFTMPKIFVYYFPLSPINCIPKTHQILMTDHLDTSHWVFSRMILGLNRNNKSKLMIVEECLLFDTIAGAHNGVS